METSPKPVEKLEAQPQIVEKSQADKIVDLYVAVQALYPEFEIDAIVEGLPTYEAYTGDEVLILQVQGRHRAAP